MELTKEILIREAGKFSEVFSTQNHISLLGITDGKAVGTYMEHAFQGYLHETYEMTVGSSASGIDLPSVNTDIKTTSYVQPQSSCPFKSDRTADFTITGLLRKMLSIGANKEDIIALLNDKNVPGDDITYNELAEEILAHPPQQGYLTISNALQWRLQYSRVIGLDNLIEGVVNYVW